MVKVARRQGESDTVRRRVPCIAFWWCKIWRGVEGGGGVYILPYLIKFRARLYLYLFDLRSSLRLLSRSFFFSQ
jgi:hypothetical protein